MRSRARISRRTFLSATGGLAGAAWLGGMPGLVRRASAGIFQDDPFQLGVLSGDPTEDGVVLWTRLAPDPLAGGGMDPVPVLVDWEVYDDETLANVVAFGHELALPESGHTVHAEVYGLEPDREYWYRFFAGGEASPPGRTRTLPWRGSLPDALRFALVSCQDYQNGYYSAYHDIAQQDLHFVVHVGDYIYEGGGGGGAVRQHDGPQIVTLEQYRNRYALYRSDPKLREAHRLHPFVCTWDDHEVDNNYAALVPEDGQSPAAFAARRAAAYQVYFEHMPLRRRHRPKTEMMRLFRRLKFGQLAHFFVLDTRQFRADQVCDDIGLTEECPERAFPGQELLGSFQRHWLARKMTKSGAAWNVMAQQVMMMQLDLLAGSTLPNSFFNFDQWDGYAWERQILMDVLAEGRARNPVVLTGDIHSAWAGDLKQDFEDESSAVVGSEFVCTSITSEFPAQLAPLVQNILPGNPHIRYFDGGRHGYTRFDVSPSLWRADYRIVDSVLDPTGESPTQTVASFVLEDGVPGLQTA